MSNRADMNRVERVARAIRAFISRSGGMLKAAQCTPAFTFISNRDDEIAQAAIDAYEKALEEEGYVVVPREPTEAMLTQEVHETWFTPPWKTHSGGIKETGPLFVKVYQAMITAALSGEKI